METQIGNCDLSYAKRNNQKTALNIKIADLLEESSSETEHRAKMTRENIPQF